MRMATRQTCCSLPCHPHPSEAPRPGSAQPTCSAKSLVPDSGTARIAAGRWFLRPCMLGRLLPASTPADIQCMACSCEDYV